MATEHLILFNQSFEVERSKVSIKIENFDIEYRPITAELESQTVDSELVGRIDATVFIYLIIHDLQPIYDSLIHILYRLMPSNLKSNDSMLI